MSLFQWGRWYKSIYEMPAADRPEDHTIQDDYELDTWFKNFLREQARKQGKNVGDGTFELIPKDPKDTIKVFQGGNA